MKGHTSLFVCRSRTFEGLRRLGSVSAALSACLLLAACTCLGHHHRPALSKSDTHAHLQPKLLVYANRIHRFNTDQLHKQLDRARRQFKHLPSGYHRLKLALLLMTPGTAVTDYDQAQSLLSAYVGKANANESDTALTALAQYLRQTVMTRQEMLGELSKEREERHRLEDKINRIVNVVGGTQRPKATH